MVPKTKVIYATKELSYRFKLLASFHDMKGIELLDKLITFAEENQKMIQK